MHFARLSMRFLFLNSATISIVFQRGPLLERMPVLDLESYYTKHAGKFESRSISPVDRKLTADPASTELSMNPLMDMLSLQSEDYSSAVSVSAGDALLNMLGGSPRPAAILSSTPGSSTSSVANFYSKVSCDRF